MTIAGGIASEDRARQKRLTPQGDQALRIKILRMDRPDAHSGGAHPCSAGFNCQIDSVSAEANDTHAR